MKIQKAVLICLLSGSLGVFAHAQAPDLSLPPLPSLDSPAGLDAPSLTHTTEASNAPTETAVELPALSPPQSTSNSNSVTERASASTIDALLPPVAMKAPPPPPADSPAPQTTTAAAPLTPATIEQNIGTIGAIAPNSDTKTSGASSSTTPAATASLPNLPSLPISPDGTMAEEAPPAPPSLTEEAAAKGIKPPELVLPPMPEATAQALLTGQPLSNADEIAPEDPDANKKKPKQTMRNLPKLEPVIVPIKNAYNYQRQMLPPSIYKREYNPENRHLPKATTRQDYDRNLFLAVASNNVNATRAFLEMGKDVNLKNAAGEPLLVVAVRYGALDTMRLLLARGANPRVSTNNGVTPLQLAEASGQNVMVAVLRSRGA
jgi:hypothetical protein